MKSGLNQSNGSCISVPSGASHRQTDIGNASNCLLRSTGNLSALPLIATKSPVNIGAVLIHGNPEAGFLLSGNIYMHDDDIKKIKVTSLFAATPVVAVPGVTNVISEEGIFDSEKSSDTIISASKNAPDKTSIYIQSKLRRFDVTRLITVNWDKRATSPFAIHVKFLYDEAHNNSPKVQDIVWYIEFGEKIDEATESFQPIFGDVFHGVIRSWQILVGGKILHLANIFRNNAPCTSCTSARPIVFALPCSHCIFCYSCYMKMTSSRTLLRTCPLCDTTIQEIFMI